MATIYWISTSSTSWSTGANWSGSSAPANGDDVVIQAIPGSSLANIAAYDASAVTLASLTISATYTGTIGNAGAGGYLQVGATAVTIGTPANDGIQAIGSGRIKLDFGSVQTTATILQTSQSGSDQNSPPVQLKGTHASNKLYVLNVSKVGVATTQPGETSTVSEVDVVGQQAMVTFGPGVTWTTANVAGGAILTLNSGSTSGTLTVAGGCKAYCYGTAKIGTVNASGQVYYNIRPASGNGITTLNLYAGGTVDFSGSPASVIVATANIFGGNTLVNAASPNHVVYTSLVLSGVKQSAYV